MLIPAIILAIENDDDREFMTTLYLNYRLLMYKEIYRITKDPWATEDLVHSTIERLIDKIPLLRDRDRDKRINYVISASKNAAFNYMQKQKRVPIFSFDDEWDSPLYADDVLVTILEKDEDTDYLGLIWNKLEPKSKFILESRFFLGKSFDEIAEDLGIQPGSVRMALTRAKREAKHLIESEIAFSG